jgi:hypothetical protein
MQIGSFYALKRERAPALTPVPKGSFFITKSNGWLIDTSCTSTWAHFVLDYVTLVTDDSGSNPKWVWNGVEAAPPPRLRFRATRQEAASFPRALPSTASPLIAPRP